MTVHDSSYFGLWGTAVFWTALMALFLLFLPFYRPVQRKPAGTFLTFVAAFSLEMYGLPFSLFLIMYLTGHQLPLGIFWGPTLFPWFGITGHYLYIAAMLVGGGLVIAGWARVYREVWTAGEKPEALLTTGVYRFLRHPQYLGLLLISFGALLDWATPVTLVLWPVLVARYVSLARREDQYLSQEFGEQWRSYAKRTGGFCPRRPAPWRH